MKRLFNQGWKDKKRPSRIYESVKEFLKRGGKIIKCPPYTFDDANRYNIKNLLG